MNEGKKDLIYRYLKVMFSEEQVKTMLDVIEQCDEAMDRIYREIQELFINIAEEQGYIHPDMINEVCAERSLEKRESREEAYS